MIQIVHQIYLIQRENEITKRFLARPGCKLPQAFQEEWSPIRNWLEGMFWYYLLLKKIDSEIFWSVLPTRENVTGRKCIFLPPSRVSSGLINIEFNDMMMTMTWWWSWGWWSLVNILLPPSRGSSRLMKNGIINMKMMMVICETQLTKTNIWIYQ